MAFGTSYAQAQKRRERVRALAAEVDGAGYAATLTALARASKQPRVQRTRSYKQIALEAVRPAASYDEATRRAPQTAPRPRPRQPGPPAPTAQGPYPSRAPAAARPVRSRLPGGREQADEEAPAARQRRATAREQRKLDARPISSLTPPSQEERDLQAIADAPDPLERTRNQARAQAQAVLRRGGSHVEAIQAAHAIDPSLILTRDDLGLPHNTLRRGFDAHNRFLAGARNVGLSFVDDPIGSAADLTTEGGFDAVQARGQDVYDSLPFHLQLAADIGFDPWWLVPGMGLSRGSLRGLGALAGRSTLGVRRAGDVAQGLRAAAAGPPLADVAGASARLAGSPQAAGAGVRTAVRAAETGAPTSAAGDPARVRPADGQRPADAGAPAPQAFAAGGDEVLHGADQLRMWRETRALVDVPTGPTRITTERLPWASPEERRRWPSMARPADYGIPRRNVEAIGEEFARLFPDAGPVHILYVDGARWANANLRRALGPEWAGDLDDLAVRERNGELIPAAMFPSAERSVIVLPENSDDALSLLAHEMAHVVQRAEWRNLDLRPNHWGAKLTDAYDHRRTVGQGALESFEEWYAQQLALYILTPNRPVGGPAGTYFKLIARKLRKLFVAISQEFGKTSEANYLFREYAEDLIERAQAGRLADGGPGTPRAQRRGGRAAPVRYGPESPDWDPASAEGLRATARQAMWQSLQTEATLDDALAALRDLMDEQRALPSQGDAERAWAQLDELDRAVDEDPADPALSRMLARIPANLLEGRIAGAVQEVQRARDAWLEARQAADQARRATRGAGVGDATPTAADRVQALSNDQLLDRLWAAAQVEARETRRRPVADRRPGDMYWINKELRRRGYDEKALMRLRMRGWDWPEEAIEEALSRGEYPRPDPDDVWAADPPAALARRQEPPATFARAADEGPLSDAERAELADLEHDASYRLIGPGPYRRLQELRERRWIDPRPDPPTGAEADIAGGPEPPVPPPEPRPGAQPSPDEAWHRILRDRAEVQQNIEAELDPAIRESLARTARAVDPGKSHTPHVLSATEEADAAARAVDKADFPALRPAPVRPVSALAKRVFAALPELPDGRAPLLDDYILEGEDVAIADLRRFDGDLAAWRRQKTLARQMLNDSLLEKGILRKNRMGQIVDERTDTIWEFNRAMHGEVNAPPAAVREEFDILRYFYDLETEIMRSWDGALLPDDQVYAARYWKVRRGRRGRPDAGGPLGARRGLPDRAPRRHHGLHAGRRGAGLRAAPLESRGPAVRPPQRRRGVPPAAVAHRPHDGARDGARGGRAAAARLDGAGGRPGLRGAAARSARTAASWAGRRATACPSRSAGGWRRCSASAGPASWASRRRRRSTWRSNSSCCSPCSSRSTWAGASSARPSTARWTRWCTCIPAAAARAAKRPAPASPACSPRTCAGPCRPSGRCRAGWGRRPGPTSRRRSGATCCSARSTPPPSRRRAASRRTACCGAGARWWTPR